MTPEIARIYYPIMVPLFLLFVGAMVLLKLKVKKDTTYDWIIRGAAILTAIFCVINRVSKVFFYLPQGGTWWLIIPDTLCSFCGLFFAIILIVKPRGNFLYHGLFYISAFGFFFTIAIPSFLNEHSIESIWALIISSSLIFHAGLGIMCSLLVISDRFKPSVNKWWVSIFTIGVTYLVGLFEWKVLNFDTSYCDVMNLAEPLVTANSFTLLFTSWYMIWLGAVTGASLIAVIYELIKQKKKFMDVLKEFNPFYKQ